MPVDNYGGGFHGGREVEALGAAVESEVSAAARPDLAKNNSEGV